MLKEAKRPFVINVESGRLPHVCRHVLKCSFTIMVYLIPTTSCVDCYVSVCIVRELRDVHGWYQLFSCC